MTQKWLKIYTWDQPIWQLDFSGSSLAIFHLPKEIIGVYLARIRISRIRIRPITHTHLKQHKNNLHKHIHTHRLLEQINSKKYLLTYKNLLKPSLKKNKAYLICWWFCPFKIYSKTNVIVVCGKLPKQTCTIFVGWNPNLNTQNIETK